ncbi:hypothetical protein CLOP_g14409 [Closterium sp. NIES-67]|nr:hypothetical protein CLOP_g14409 [Closterium sp. NIES-67]
MSNGATKQRSRRIAGALWTPEEDNILLAHVAKHGTHNWLLVKSMGLLPTRNHKACCNRYILLKRKLSKLGHLTAHMDMAAKGEIPAVPTMPAVAAVPLLTAVPTVAADGGLTRDTAKAAKAGMAAVPTVPANAAAVPTMPRATGTAAAPTMPANAGMGTAKTTQQTLDERDECLFRASFCHQQHSCCRQQQFRSCHQHHASSQHQHTPNHQQWDTETIMAESSPLMRGMQNSTAAAKAECSCKRASGEPFASATLDLQIESATTVMSQANMEDEAAEAASDEMMVGITSPAAMSSHSLCAPKCVHIPTSRIIRSAPKESLQTPQMHLSGSEHCLPVFPSQPLLQATSESSTSKPFAAHLLPPHRTVSLTLPPIRPPTLDLPPTRPPTPPTTPTTLPPPLSLPHGKVDNGTSILVAAPAQELKGVETTCLVDSPMQDLEEIEAFLGALPDQTNLQMPQQVHQQVHQQENSAEGINAYCSLPVVANQRPLVYHAAQGAVSADTSHRHQHVPAGDAAANAPPPSADMAPPLYADAARFPTSPFAHAPSPTAPFPSAPCPTVPSAASSLSAGAILLAFADLLSAAAVSPDLPGPRCAAMAAVAPTVSSDWPAAIDAAASTAAIDGAIASLLIQAELIRINNARLLLAPIPPTSATAVQVAPAPSPRHPKLTARPSAPLSVALFAPLSIPLSTPLTTPSGPFSAPLSASQPTSQSRTPVLRIPPLSLPPAAPPSAAAPPAAAAHQPSPPPPTPPPPAAAAAAAAAAATPATISSLFLGPSSSAAVAAADGRAADAAAEARLKPDELFEAWCNGPFARMSCL